MVDASSIAYEPSPDALVLPVGRTRTPALSGDPLESYEVMYRDGTARSGVWECTPGRFESARDGDCELMHFISGVGTITSDDGTVHDIRPGAVVIAPDGWRGVWDIRETVRKVYAIWTAPTADIME